MFQYWRQLEQLKVLFKFSLNTSQEQTALRSLGSPNYEEEPISGSGIRVNRES